MAWKMYRREHHARRIVRRRRQHHVRPFWGYGRPNAARAAWPRIRWEALGRFDTLEEAREMRRAHPGAVIEEYCLFVYGRSGPQLFHRVGIPHREGAPFRQPVMTWALEIEVRRYEQTQAARWLERRGLKGGVKPYRGWYHRCWRRAGREICRLALCGELERAEELDPQPRKRGIMWDVW